MNMNIAIVTLVKNRQPALLNFLKGIVKLSEYPDELIIIHMNEAAYPIPELPVRVKQIALQSDSKLPLAEARNAAVANAKSDYIIFLDVDCIASPNLVSDYKSAFQKADQLWSGKVRYLDKAAMDNEQLWESMHQISQPDPVRENLEKYTYEVFWSLNFGCSKSVFTQIGGFNENYKGYGAEDTDFAFRARQSKVALGTVNTFAYHQYHPSYNPPLNHLQDIVNNAKVFKQIWKVWPMEGWLSKFRSMGYVHWKGDELQILKMPDSMKIQECLKS
jgi:GT2 family glycosyltransferase